MQKGQSHMRSEKIRRRLNEESKNWIDQASRHITDPSPLNIQNHGHMKIDNLNNGQDATKRNMFFKIGWRLLSFILTAAFSLAIFSAWQSPQYKVSDVHINGLQRLSEDAVLDTLDIYGKHIFSLESEKIICSIRDNYPELRNISVSYILPAQVIIQVAERQPVISWKYDGNTIWIDSEGYLIPARGIADQMLTIKADSLPSYQIINNENQGDVKNIIFDKPIFKEVSNNFLFFTLPKQIEENLLTGILQLNAWMPEESSLLYQKERGLGWRDARGWDVFVGSKLENINDKMLMYETIIRNLEEQGIQPSIVSVEFLHAPYYRLDE